ncbi:tripartite tricarboxylate transporter TctB family protein [Sulfitobacter sp. AS92]|uniref:tripartite tricarboxylate transporter TctB family protein n=1 Tax=Sulfitobacter sp. AS92 TaxID=3135783 RepID=UPI003171109D
MFLNGQDRLEIATASVFLLIGIAFCVHSFSLPRAALEPMGPAAVPFAVSFGLSLLSLHMIYGCLRRGATTGTLGDALGARFWVTVCLICIYLLAMDLAVLPYRIATTAFLFVLTAGLFRFERSKVLVAAAIALILGFGLTYVFTEILVLDLP